MALTVDDKGGDFKTVEAGTYVARCVKIIDLGTQHGEYQGKPIAKKQVLIMWELPTEIIEEGEYQGKPYSISKFYTASLNEKASLRKDLEAWRGRVFTPDELKGFNLINILGQPCMLTISHNENKRAKISGVGKIMKGMTCPVQVTPSVSFDLDAYLCGNNEQTTIFNGLSEKMQDLVKKSEECQRQTDGFATDEGGHFNPDDDIPF